MKRECKIKQSTKGDVLQYVHIYHKPNYRYEYDTALAASSGALAQLAAPLLPLLGYSNHKRALYFINYHGFYTSFHFTFYLNNLFLDSIRQSTDGRRRTTDGRLTTNGRRWADDGWTTTDGLRRTTSDGRWTTTNDDAPCCYDFMICW